MGKVEGNADKKWDVLVGTVLWSAIPVKKTFKWKATYLLCCSHGLVINNLTGNYV